MTPTDTAPQLFYSSLGDDPDLADIVDLFVDEMPGRVAALVDGLEKHDRDGLGMAAHQLKGAAGSYGFHQLTPYAAKLEQAARSPVPEEELRDAVDALIDVCRRVRARPATT